MSDQPTSSFAVSESQTPHQLPLLDRLSALGRTDISHIAREWRDYRVVAGVTVEDIPDLIRILRDWREYWTQTVAGSEELLPIAYAPVHAWRALGQLHAVEAIEPLLETMNELISEEDEDFSLSEIPKAIALIGPSATDSLRAFAFDPGRELWARVGATDAMGFIARQFTESKSEITQILAELLDRDGGNPPQLNAQIIVVLLDLKATQAAPAIRRVYAADSVDGTICGTWDDVQRKLGIQRSPEDPPHKSIDEYYKQYNPEMYDLRNMVRAMAGNDPEQPGVSFPGQQRPARSMERERERERNKRKQAKKARRQNRRR